MGHTLPPAVTTVSPIGSSPHTWGILEERNTENAVRRFIPTYVGHTENNTAVVGRMAVHPHIRGAYAIPGTSLAHNAVHPHIRGAYSTRRMWYFIATGSSPHTWGIQGRFLGNIVGRGSSPHTWGIHWTAVRKMAGFSHFSYDFIRKSYFVQGLVFFGVIGAEAFPTHRRGRSQCLPGAHGRSVRNL